MKNKRFTLVEVLAVIVILGVIALIVVPKVSDIISSSKKQAGMESALSYVRAVDQYVIEANDDDSKDAHISNGDNLFSYITISGTKASDGKIYVDEDKNVSIALQIGAYCYKKEAVDKNTDITVTKTDTCTVEPKTPTSCFTYHKITSEVVDSFRSKYGVTLNVGDIAITGYTCGDGIKTRSGVSPDSSSYLKNVFYDNGNFTNIKRPSKIAGSPVTVIYGAFMVSTDTSYEVVTASNNLYNNYKTSLLPNNYSNHYTIETTGIDGDDDLHAGIHSVVIPSSVKFLYKAFCGNELTKVTFADRTDKLLIGEDSFTLNQLTNIELPENTIIGDYAFASNNLTSLVLPGSTKFADKINSSNVSDSAFYNNKIASLTIGDGITDLGDYAFSYNSLQSLTIPNSVTSIGYSAFASNQLTSITIPSSVTSIGAGALANNSLTSVTIPNGVTSIGDGAFEENQLTNVTIPSSVTSIGDYAFEDNHLTSVTIPSSVTNIGAAAFNINDFPLDKAIIYARNSDGTENKTIIVSYAHTGDSVTIPDGVTTIGNCAFGYSYLTSVTIPNSVTSIEYDSFENNSSLTAITVDNMPNKIANSPWGATNATITYLRGVHINIDSSITDLNVSPALVVAENSTITFTSSTLGKKVTSVTIDGVVNSGNTFTVGTADISVTAYTYDTVPYYTFATAHNYANNLDGSVSGTSLWTQTITGASSIDITFSSDSRTESGWDYIFICSDNCSVTRTSTTGYLYKLAGTDMAGKTYNVTGDTIYVKFFSDGSQVYNGFTATVIQN